MRAITGRAIIAGVAGHPVAHSLSPFLHNRWIALAGLDAAYIPFSPAADGFARLVEGLRGGAIRGINVTAPFKREALALATRADAAARACGSANLLLFHPDGAIEARSTDGVGVLNALARRVPGLAPGVAAILGAGGAAAAAAAALAGAGWRVRLVNRTLVNAQVLAATLPGVTANGLDDRHALEDAALVVNAIGGEPPALDLPHRAVAFDMRYTPHETAFLRAAASRGHSVVHGIDMLIAQAEPSFAAFFGVSPPDLPGLRDEAIARIAAG